MRTLYSSMLRYPYPRGRPLAISCGLIIIGYRYPIIPELTMDRIVAISDTANIAIHALALADANGGSISAREVATRLGVSSTYLAKIMQRLAAKGFFRPSRGLGGGYALAKPADAISCLDVVEALEGDIPHRECLFAKAVCRTRTCALRVFCEETEAQLRNALSLTTVSAVARSF